MRTLAEDVRHHTIRGTAERGDVVRCAMIVHPSGQTCGLALDCYRWHEDVETSVGVFRFGCAAGHDFTLLRPPPGTLN